MYSKTYRAVVPIDKSQAVDDSVVVWLTRESFDRAAAADALIVVAFNDLGQVAAEDIPPKAEKQLGRPVTDFVWRSFEGVGQRA